MATISRNVPWMVDAIITKIEPEKINGNVTIIQMPLPNNNSAAVWLIDSDKTKMNLMKSLDLHREAEVVHL